MISLQIVNFIDSRPDLSIGFNEINFFKSHNIEESQSGYSHDLNGRPLTGSGVGDWKDSWLVIATDQLGDPIFIDIDTLGFAVYSAAIGEGIWEPYVIADSLIGFEDIIEQLQKLSIGRTNPIEMEKNIIPEAEKRSFLNHVALENSNVDLWYWEEFLQ